LWSSKKSISFGLLPPYRAVCPESAGHLTEKIHAGLRTEQLRQPDLAEEAFGHQALALPAAVRRYPHYVAYLVDVS
jgi:hypothetical protein